MKTKVSKWGNSLALRIPSRLASRYHLTEGSDVEIIEHEGELKLRSIPSNNLRLEDLLLGITKENLHGELVTWKVEGKEIW